jgi:hypothetical protein
MFAVVDIMAYRTNNIYVVNPKFHILGSNGTLVMV